MIHDAIHDARRFLGADEPKLFTHDRMARAFNRGCDARLAGEPLSANPYEKLGHEHDSWAYGWRDVHHSWGRMSRRPFRKLPPVEC